MKGKKPPEAMRAPRLLPLAIFAAIGLGLLKVSGMLGSGAYLFAESAVPDPSSGTPSTAQGPPTEPLLPDGSEVTSAIGTNDDDKAGDANQGQRPQGDQAQNRGAGNLADGLALPPPATGPDAAPGMSESERRVLLLLSERRQELDAYRDGLALREQALIVGEQKLEARLSALSELEAKVRALIDAEKQKADAKVENLVTVYSSMKPKAAAKIFNRLAAQTLFEVAKRMKPKSLSAIVAQMDLEQARLLTEALMENSDDLLKRLHGIPDPVGLPPIIGEAVPRIN